MPLQNKLIKQGINYTDTLFDEISKRLEQGVKASDSLESFLDKYHKAFPDKDNPVISLGYDQTLLDLILSETNNHKFSRPSQKELVRVTIENQVGELIKDVGDDVRDSVREIVKDGYNNNLSQDEIAANISAKVDSIKNTRARAIARTEIARAATISDYVINAERGATHFYVECRNTACPICKEAWHNNWSKANDETFKPNDTSASGKGWIGDRVYSMSDTGMLPPIHPNCRCVPYFVNESEMPKKGVIQDNSTESIESESPNLFSKNISKKLDDFGEKYEQSPKEHLQYFSETDKSEVSMGTGIDVRKNGAIRKWLSEKERTGEEIHKTHNHPTNEKRKEGYTMLSYKDLDTFVKDNVTNNLNLKTCSAENEYNRITVERLPNFHEAYKKGIKDGESLGQGTSRAIIRACTLQEEFYDKYHPTISPGLEYKRKKNAELKAKGVKGIELFEKMDEYEEEATKIDKDFFEERQREFPKLIKAMNEELNPYGLNISAKYKTGPYARN